MNFEDSYRKRERMINILDDRSEGEIGANIGLGESIGELNINQPKAVKRDGSRGKQRYNAVSKKDERPLGQTIGTDYEGGLHSNSKNKSGIIDDLENPIYDSKEDPIPKVKKIRANGNGNINMMSGESFGNPLNRSSGHNQIKNGGGRGMPHRDKIAEDFLEDDDDVAESGEINPGMFR